MEELRGLSEVLVQQEERYGGVIVGRQPGVAYTVKAPGGTTLCHVSEVGGTTASRFLMGSHRALCLEMRRPNGTVVTRMSRPFFTVWPSLHLQGPDGRLRGTVRKRFVPVHDAYEIRDEHGRELFRVLRKRWAPSSCVVQQYGKDVAGIEREIRDLRRETSTSFNDYRVSFPPDADPVGKCLLLGATLLIDLIHFE